MNNIADLTSKLLADGISGKYVHGDKLSLGLVSIEKGSLLALHHHPHEQITYMLNGEMEMNIGGEKILLRNGDYWVIPSNVPHSAIAISDCTVIDVFSPVREDYKK